MRKALIAVVVASALFAVGAFAASFDMQAEDVASGTDAVDRCAANADVDFTETFDTATNNWNVSSITVTLTGEDPLDCVGANATLVLQNQGDGIVLQEEKAVPAATGGVVSVSYTPTATNLTDGLLPLTVAEIWHSAVLIDDVDIPVV